MADNVSLPATSGTIATDDVGGVQYQRVKLAWGAEGIANDASASAPLPVIEAAFTSVACGEFIAGTTAAQFPSVTCKMAYLRANPSNTGTIYLGGAGVTMPDGTADTTTGYPITSGEKFGPIAVANMNQLYAIASVAAQGIMYFANN